MNDIGRLYATPVVDLTTVNAVESGFKNGPIDPWFEDCLRRFIDITIYADKPFYTVPVTDSGIDPASVGIPQFLKEINKHEQLKYFPLPYYAVESPVPEKDALEEPIESFTKWVKENRLNVVKWSAYHSSADTKADHQTRLAKVLLFEFDDSIRRSFGDLVGPGLTIENIVYCFDVVLRLPHYAGLTPNGQRYLSHPVRDAYTFLGTSYERSKAIDNIIPISFGKWFVKKIQLSPEKWSREEIVGLVMNLKEAVHEYGREKLWSEVSREDVRKICLRANLPPELREDLQKYVTLALDGLVKIGMFSLGANLLETLSGMGAVNLQMQRWRERGGQLPSKANDFRYFRWALQWKEMEDQVKRQ